MQTEFGREVNVTEIYISCLDNETYLASPLVICIHQNKPETFWNCEGGLTNAARSKRRKRSHWRWQIES